MKTNARAIRIAIQTSTLHAWFDMTPARFATLLVSLELRLPSALDAIWLESP